ncbi:methyltransferase domain-containing protein [uncultured Sunxiuqinia sp.]|uniref:methyltransferase domain-containing protein n=1 Tax=uncultured Sunxiuqinia sp. TaxID=1573825 RepID=UPI00262902F6|nr:methyltransferase domain-containing protein [uncultured Sunxiuqinia sp.]
MNKLKLFRFEKTEAFLNKYLSKELRVLDLGTPNELSDYLSSRDYQIQNGHGFDFDLEPQKVNDYDYEVLTAFEVLEHLVSPFSIMQQTKAQKLVVTVPLKLWFAKAYRNASDPYDQHYHEFESWQLDMMLEKAGWEIKAREKWVPPFQFNGVRSILRALTPRFYAVYAERKS